MKMFRPKHDIEKTENPNYFRTRRRIGKSNFLLDTETDYSDTILWGR